MNYPPTIYNPAKFEQKLPPGFDGVFDWSWTFGCFGDTKIEPMDFDGVVERRGNFLVFETKEPGRDIPAGQRITLKTAFQSGLFTVIFVWGKRSPEVIEVWHPEVEKVLRYEGVEKARLAVSHWFKWANRNPKNVDTTILNRRVLTLQQENERLIEKAERAIDLLKSAIDILGRE